MTPQQRFDVVVYRMESAKRLLVEIESHIDDGYYNTAINRMYYACFYAVSALLIHNEIDGLKTHEGVRQHFGKNFIVTGKMDRKWGHFYTSLYTSRSAADYEDFKEYNEMETRSFFPEVKRFITLIDELSIDRANHFINECWIFVSSLFVCREVSPIISLRC